MKRIFIAALGILTLGFVGGLVVAGNPSLTSPSAAAPEQMPGQVVRPAAPAPTLPSNAALPNLSDVAEVALKVAANISSTTVVRQRVAMPFPFFFDEPDRFQQVESQSLGSGVVVSADGLVVTNTHVIGSRDASVRVTLEDGKERPGRIVGIDELSDLAVIKVEATGLRTLPWGDSDKLRVAEWVLAIGNPFQLNRTVTLGIVSAVSRARSDSFTDFIQTDAAINHGNSGGALVNARGELVGINSQIVSPDDTGFIGIGFAIPSNTVRRIMAELVQYGSVRWGSIGYIEFVDAPTARAYGISGGPGLLVTRMFAQGAAYRAGLRPRDWIVSFAGTAVSDPDQLTKLIAASKVGATVRMETQRDGRPMTLSIPVESRDQQQMPTRRTR